MTVARFSHTFRAWYSSTESISRRRWCYRDNEEQWLDDDDEGRETDQRCGDDEHQGLDDDDCGSRDVGKNEWLLAVTPVHVIEVQGKGRNARWQQVEAFTTIHHNQRGHKRRMWCEPARYVSSSEHKLACWPTDVKTVGHRRLRDLQIVSDRPRGLEVRDNAHVSSREFKVAVKIDSQGRRIWREVIPAGKRARMKRRSSREDGLKGEDVGVGEMVDG